MKTRAIGTTLAIAFGLMAGVATADTRAYDKAMAPIVDEYAKVHESLAADKTTGVAASAKKIERLARKLNPKSVSGKHAKHYAGLPAKIRVASARLQKAKSLADARAAFMQLSRPLAMWVTMSKPTGLNVVFCSMAKGSWLQKDKKIRNPYYGAKMLRCGEIVSGSHKGHASGHMQSPKHDHGKH